MPAASKLSSVADCQLLRQLGARLKAARIARSLTTSEMSQSAGISRMTLSAVEGGEPSATMGSYVRVMSVLDLSKDLAVVASDALRGGVPPPNLLDVRLTNEKHEAQDVQSLVLHQEAVRLIKAQPELLQRALQTLESWRESKTSHSRHLLDEWAVILHRRAWRRALSNTQRSTELRQASPLVTVLPKETRERILNEVKDLRRGERPKPE